MRIHLSDDQGNLHSLDVDGSMEVETLSALVEVEMQIPPAQQILIFNGNQLADPKQTISAAGIKHDELVFVSRRQQQQQRQQQHGGGRTGGATSRDPRALAETVRQQILADPHMLRNLASYNAPLATAAQNDPDLFARMYIELETKRREMEENQRAQEEALRNADPFDVDAQRRIEESIKQANILENEGNAMEYHPESFGRVVMLYIPVIVNGKPVKAFVDSGAQSTIMSPELAESCNMMHLLDTRYAGIAQGVGTAKILGRIHSAPMKVGSQFLPCGFSIMEGKGVDLLFGLDMLKRHAAVIDLEKDCLRIHGEEVKFLSEHELPAKARWEGAPDDPDAAAKSPLEGGSAAQGAVHPETPLHPAGSGGTSTTPIVVPSTSTVPSTPAPPPAPPSQGQGQGPPPPPPPAPAPVTGGRGSSSYDRAKIQVLLDLGITEPEAIAALDATNGDADQAASLLFQ
ncbi:DNA damage-inducible protein 1 [Thoreauomyces humboldtii]|nr:DNA damage-inducible protein 1 [Thoreauomyces humboldtii]